MSSKHEIIPAIISLSYEDFVQKVKSVKDDVDWVQIDAMDGIFVDAVSWPYQAEDLTGFQQMVDEKRTLPFLDNVKYEVHLMTEHPEVEIPKWYSLGVSRFIVHFESIDNVDVLEHIIVKYGRNGKTEVGIALSSGTSVEDIEPIVDEIDCVLLMSIKRIGYQGEPFDETAIDKIKHLREMSKNVIISVDGGVSLQTAPHILIAGANRLNIGSAIFDEEDVSTVIQKFKAL